MATTTSSTGPVMMVSAKPEVSVVVITHNRARRLAALLDSFRTQTVDRDRFEIVVVDDCSSDDTAELLEEELVTGELPLKVLRRSRPPGRAAARNDGWRAAKADLIAFIDDDCVATPKWLEEGLLACAAYPGAIVQGRVDPNPAEESDLSPAARSQWIHRAGPYYQTCNIFYPRKLIAAVGGFDAAAFRAHGGEDTDLAWRAISRGAPTAFAERAHAYHAVNRIGLLRRLLFASHWSESMIVYKRYPVLRQAVFTKRIFWKPWHYSLIRVLVAALLPRRLWFVRQYLVIPYVRSIELRCHNERGRFWHWLFYPLEDAVETATMVRASVRHRMLVL